MLKGAKLGRYVLDQHLFTKGVTDIWLATIHGNSGYDQKVILKMISDSSHFEKNAPELKAEAYSAALLHHSNIVEFYEFGHSDTNIPYLATEFIHGKNLDAIWKQGLALNRRIPIWLIVSVIAQCCEGLQYAYESTKLLHHTIGPETLLVTFTGESKIRGFGAILSESPNKFMAPETVSKSQVDVRSNIYSLGMILHFFAYGHLADSDTVVPPGTLAEGTLPDGSKPRVAPKLAKLIHRALEPSAEKRYQSFADFRIALTQTLEDRSPIQEDIAMFLGALFIDEDIPRYIRKQLKNTAADLESLGFMDDVTTNEVEHVITEGAYDSILVNDIELPDEEANLVENETDTVESEEEPILQAEPVAEDSKANPENITETQDQGKSVPWPQFGQEDSTGDDDLGQEDSTGDDDLGQEPVSEVFKNFAENSVSEMQGEENSGPLKIWTTTDVNVPKPIASTRGKAETTKRNLFTPLDSQKPLGSGKSLFQKKVPKDDAANPWPWQGSKRPEDE